MSPLRITLLVLVGPVLTIADPPRHISAFCTGGYQSAECGTLVAVMPPDVPVPTGGLANPSESDDFLILGDTVGRTPGAYGFVVSCNLVGVLGEDDVVSSASLILSRGGAKGVDPLSEAWESTAGPGPASVLLDMVCTQLCRAMKSLCGDVHC